MWIAFIIAAAVVLLDQITKLIVELNLNEDQFVTCIPHFLKFTKCYNTGAAWSSFSDAPVFLVIVSLVSSVIISWAIYRFIKEYKKMKTLTFAAGFILGGCVGNLFDRFMTSINVRNGVIDMIDFAPFNAVSRLLSKENFPTFNVADFFLVTGVILLVIDILFFMDKRKEKKDA